jgi:hypothetical protein
MNPSSGPDADGGMPMMDMPGMDMGGMHHQMQMADGGMMDMPGMKMGSSDGGTRTPTHRKQRRHNHEAQKGAAAPDAGTAHGHHQMQMADGGMMDMPGMQMNGGAP